MMLSGRLSVSGTGFIRRLALAPRLKRGHHQERAKYERYGLPEEALCTSRVARHAPLLSQKTREIAFTIFF